MELAINVTIVRLTVVFLVLTALTFIISLLGKLLNNTKKDHVAKNEDLKDYKLVEEENELETESEVLELETEIKTNNQLIAVLTAAIAASLTDTNSSGFRVISFKRPPPPDSLWSTVARNEQIGCK